jgi:hypothetical protein
MTDETPRSPSRPHLPQVAAGCAPGPLSELSVAQRSTSLPRPDLTRGGWSGKRA